MSKSPTPLHGLLVAVLAAGMTLSLRTSGVARAAVLTVTTSTDELNADGDCSLREAIRAANTDTAVDACGAGSGSDTLLIPAGTYTLTLTGAPEDAAASGDLDLLQPVTLVGAGVNVTIIDGNATDRVLHVLAQGVSLNTLTIRNGNSGSNNAAGIQIVNGSVTGAQIAVTGNSGNIGGIHVGSDASLTLLESVVAENSGASAGGIFVSGSGVAVLDRTLVATNTVSFDGGGVWSSGDVTVINSTISGNTANTDGGGLNIVSGTARLFNATITGNSADNSGSGGDGGGLFVDPSAVVTATNSLIAANVDLSSTGSPAPDCTGPINSGGYSLLQTSIGCTWGTGAGDVIGATPLLAALLANDGPTRTHALLAGSPAIDAGDPAGCGDAQGARLWVDQRGDARIGRCDIGAFEYGSAGDPRWLWLPQLANVAAP